MSAIFISYTNRDEDGQRWALWLMERLRAWKYESRFLDKDETDGIRVGDDWRRELHQKLAHCRVVIAICSSAYETSPWCMAEVGIAVDRGKRLFPVVVGGASLPLLLQHSQSVSLSDSIQVTGPPDDTSGALLKLRESLNNILAERTGQSLEKIRADSERDYFMSADEARDYGLIDQVISKRS
jgi:hypothetical protein